MTAGNARRTKPGKGGDPKLDCLLRHGEDAAAADERGIVMDRETAVMLWHKAGRDVGFFASMIEAAERERCAKACRSAVYGRVGSATMRQVADWCAEEISSERAPFPGA